jgi:cap2 methyltransferase
MIKYQNESVTKEEYKEIIYGNIKIDFYDLNCFPRFVNDLPNNLNYREHIYEERKLHLHKGQYKLYLSELDFLTDYVNFNYIVIYVGAAPGHHINELYDKFKQFNLEYHLYDVNYFDSNLQLKKNIKIFNEYFTNDHCEKYKNNNVLFISDIRKIEDMSTIETDVSIDMKYQMDWVLAIKPIASMLKFRLPYSSDKIVNYLDGDLRIQAYAPNSTTESRLVSVYPYKIKQYNPKELEDRMFYLNKIIRYWYHYDNLLEEYIINKYNKYIIQQI